MSPASSRSPLGRSPVCKSSIVTRPSHLQLTTTDRRPTALSSVPADPAVVYISLTSPPKILKASPAWLEMFRLEAQTCLGCSMNCLLGPETVAEKLVALVDGVRGARAGTTHIVLYTSEGDKALYALSATPACGPFGQNPPVCKLTMVKSDAVPYTLAAVDDGRCKLVVEAARPFRIVTCTKEFERKYGFPREHAVNKPLSIIQGPDTDVHAWRALLDSALQGCAQHLPLVHAYARNGSGLGESVCLRLTPVLGASDIDFVLVALDPPEPPSAFVEPSSRLHRGSTAAVAAERPSCARISESQSPIRITPTERHPRTVSQEPCNRGTRSGAPNLSAAQMALQPRSSVSMGEVNKHIATECRARILQKRAADKKTAAATMTAASEVVFAPDSKLGGIVSFFTSIFKYIYILTMFQLMPVSATTHTHIHTHTATTTPEKNTTVRNRPVLRRSWSYIHGSDVGMGAGDLELFTAY